MDLDKLSPLILMLRFIEYLHFVSVDVSTSICTGIYRYSENQYLQEHIYFDVTMQAHL